MVVLLVAEKMLKVLTEVLRMMMIQKVFRRAHQDLAVEPGLSWAAVSGLMRMKIVLKMRGRMEQREEVLDTGD